MSTIIMEPDYDVAAARFWADEAPISVIAANGTTRARLNMAPSFGVELSPADETALLAPLG